MSTFALLVLACSSTVRVPPSDYDNPGSAAAYRVTTVDKKSYSIKHYTLADSVVVVSEFTKSYPPAGQDSLQVPFKIPLKDVESIDRVTLDRGKSSGWVFGAGVAFLAVAIMAGIAAGLAAAD